MLDRQRRIGGVMEQTTAGSAPLVERPWFKYGMLGFILLLDLKMPRVDGFDVLHSLKQAQRLRCNPVIVLSSSQEPTDIRRAYELGANAFVQKPRDLDGYRKIIHCLREFWLEMNKCPAPANSALAAHTGSCQ